MNKKYLLLLTLLEQSKGPLTAAELAVCLSVSVRSLKSYVAQINAEQPRIVAGKNGYTLLTGRDLPATQSTDTDNIPKDYEERSAMLVKRLLIERNYIDIYVLSELMCISDTTCRANISRMNKTYADFGVKFSVEHDYPQVKGSEVDKRRLIRHVIASEAEGAFLSTALLERWFDPTDVEKVLRLTGHALREFGCDISGFALSYLAFNLLVMLVRMRNGKYLGTFPHPASPEEKEYQAAVRLADELSTAFGVRFLEAEVGELYFWIATSDHQGVTVLCDQLEVIVGEDVIPFARETLSSIHEHYFIDLHSNNFFPAFCLHIKKLLMRLRRHQEPLINPMIFIVKSSSPLLFDIATYFADLFYGRFRLRLSEDEIACFAILFGGEVERQNLPTSKVRASLLCPAYLNMREQLAGQILTEFGGKLELGMQGNSLDELEDLSELLISALPIKQSLSVPICTVSPYLTSPERKKLYDTIEEVLEKRSYQILRQNFNRFFAPQLFFANYSIQHRDDCIPLLCDTLEQHGYVDSSFLEQVRYRETLSSTAFFQLAIPHSMERDALHTGVCVLLSHTGVDWESAQRVNVVLMVALSEKDKQVFNPFYQSLAKVFSNLDFLLSVIKCGNFEAFREAVLSAL